MGDKRYAGFYAVMIDGGVMDSMAFRGKIKMSNDDQ